MRGGQPLRLILLVALLLYGQPPQACPRSDCIRIGSWNIEWLGSSHRSQPSDRATLDAMASLIANELSIDLITLQEINTDLEGKIQGEQYSLLAWNQLKEALERHGYQAYSGNSGYAQHIVLAWRQPVKSVRTPFELALTESYELGEFCRSSRLRKPLAGQFKSKQFDFWVVGLHLKSSAGQSDCSAAIRRKQVAQLEKEIKKLRVYDPDIILAGDFNASQKHETLSGLAENSFHALHQRKLRNPASGNYSYRSENATREDSGSLVDHIMVSSRHTKEWLPYSATIYKPANADKFSKTYSDHLPIWVDFSTLEDDD